MPLDPRTPVIVAAAQLTRRAEKAEGQSDPVSMMAEVLTSSQVGGSARSLIGRACSVQVVDVISWRYTNPARLLAELLGADPRETVSSTIGGNSPQMMVNAACRRIASGELDIAVIAGAEAGYSRKLAREQGVKANWPAGPSAAPEQGDVRIGDDRFAGHEAELARGLILPVQHYPIFENALRAANRRSVDDHLAIIGRLWSNFSKVASTNPHAWLPEVKSPEEITNPSDDNRMVSYPYTKLLCANLMVDQAAALVVCSAEAAEAAGVPRDEWVFPIAGTDAYDHWFVSERADLYSSPAVRACARAALELAGVGVDEVAHFDLYSCFTSAVEVAAREIGLDLFDQRGLTVTGGLVFAGGPGNNYVTHAIAAMVDRLRSDGGASIGVVTGNGWFLTKHSFGVYSTEPSAAGYRTERPQAEVDASPKREVASEYDGPVAIESFTVDYDRDGSPGTAYVACLLEDGRRAWGKSSDVDVMKALETSDLIGTPARLAQDSTLQLR